MKLPFCQKSKDDFFPKHARKDDIYGITEKDDIHPIKDDIDILCTFIETFLSVFIYCFPNKKNPGNLIYRVEILTLSCTIQPSGVVFRDVPERQLRKIFVH